MQSWKESTELKMNCLAIRFFESEASHAIYYVVRNNLLCIFVEKFQELHPQYIWLGNNDHVGNFQ